MRVLLVILKVTADEVVDPLIPIGTAYINGALRADGGFEMDGCNLNYEGVDTLREKLANTDVVLGGGTVKDWHKLTWLFTVAREVRPDIITVGGGAGYTASPIPFSELTGPDYAVVGEGEYTVPELLHAIERGEDVSAIQGVIYKADGQYRLTGFREEIRDLDSLPFPSYDGLALEAHFAYQNRSRKGKLQNKNYYLLRFDEDEYSREIPMCLSRSCPFSCKFCFHSVGNHYRIRSLDSFFQELDWLIETYHVNGIQLIDELFGLNEAIISEFCDRIERYHIPWFAEIRVETASAEMLKRMRRAGCQNIQFGIENINAEVLKNMNKKITRPMIEKALKNAYDAGMIVSGNILIGAENDTWTYFLENFDWWNANRRYMIHMILIEQYTGTAYFKNCLKRGVIRDEKEYIRRGMPRVNMSGMSDYEWNKMKRMMQLARIDKGFQAPIRIVPDNEPGTVRAEITCLHCGQRYSVILSEEEWNSEKGINSYCDGCGRLNPIDRQDHRKHFQYLLMDQWISNQAAGVAFGGWLTAQGFFRIGLVWDTPFAQLFYEHFRSSEAFTVCCISDDLPETKLNYPDECVVSRDRMGEYAPDCILICESAEFLSARKAFREKGYTGEIISSADVLFGHRFHASDIKEKNNG